MLSTRAVSWNRQEDSKCEWSPTLYYTAKPSTEGEQSLIKHFVTSLSMPNELLMSKWKVFLKTWASGKLPRAILRLACPKGKLELKFLSSPVNPHKINWCRQQTGSILSHFETKRHIWPHCFEGFSLKRTTVWIFRILIKLSFYNNWANSSRWLANFYCQ